MKMASITTKVTERLAEGIKRFQQRQAQPISFARRIRENSRRCGFRIPNKCAASEGSVRLRSIGDVGTMAAGLFLFTFFVFTLPLSAFAANFQSVTYHRCYDGDTCTFTIPSVHPLFGDKINVRLAGIDTAEIRGKCDQEKALARKARDIVRQILNQATRIDLVDASRGKYFRIVAIVVADGQDVSRVLITRGLAIPYDGGRKTQRWCD